MLLQRELVSRFGVRPGRVVVYTGARVTNHNLRLILHYAKEVHEFTQRSVHLRLVEEGFLVRRAAAGLAAQLRRDAAAAAVVRSAHFTAVGPRTFEALVAAHRGRTDVALALVLGEHGRLQRYQTAGNGSTATHGLVQRGAVLDASALEAMEPRAAAAVEALRARHAEGLLARGLRVLEQLPREEMLRIATPLQGPGEVSLQEPSAALHARLSPLAWPGVPWHGTMLLSVLSLALAWLGLARLGASRGRLRVGALGLLRECLGWHAEPSLP